MSPPSRRFRDVIRKARSLDELMQRIREAIQLCLESDNLPTDSLEFVGVQRITIAA